MSDPDTLALERRPGLERRDAFRAAGRMGRFNPENSGAIPDLWTWLVPRMPIPGSRGGTLGLSLPIAPAEGVFDYMAGVEMEDGAPTPEGMDVAEVPAQTYAVWRLTITGGPLHPQMQAALGDIWGRRLKADGLKPSGGPNFELYPPYFDQAKAGQTVEFWIPVQA